MSRAGGMMSEETGGCAGETGELAGDRPSDDESTALGTAAPREHPVSNPSSSTPRLSPTCRSSP